MNEHRTRERERLAFVIKRDGFFGAVSFAKQTYAQYRAARRKALEEGRGYGQAYREQLVASCIELRAFLRAVGG